MTDSREPLRVLNCIHSLEAGGAERVVLRFTKAWREHGIDARIALGRREGVLQAEASDVPFFVMQTGGASTARFETLWMIWKLPTIIRQFRPDVLFFGVNALAIIALATRLRMGRECPPIVLKISQDLRRPDMSAFALRVDRWLLRLHAWVYARVVAIAEPAKAQIMAEMGLPPDRVVVINNASMTLNDLERFAAARTRSAHNTVPSSDSARHFISVGRLMPQKNFELLIRAFARIARPSDRLTIVGEGPNRRKIETLIQSLGIANQVRLPGYQRAIEEWLADSDAFVLSSDFEGLGNVVVEALAAGLPIVATRCCAAMPMLIEGAGSVVAIKDVAALASAMDNICNLPIDRKMMRNRAAQFTTEASTHHWAALFKSVVR